MISIYKRLLKYQETCDRSNLENYLTEILCDFLNKITKVENKSFIKDVVFSSCETSQFQDFINNHDFNSKHTYIEWKTQYSINISGTTKYPDLIGFINKKPAVLIEVKVNASFTERWHEDELGNQIITPQLNDYGNWLNKYNADGILVLLSYSTKAPDDFFSKTKNYDIGLRNYSDWQNIYNWLNKINNNNQLYLIKDFMSFLLEKNMANESPNLTDFSALEIFISGSGERIDGMMKFTREELEKKCKENINWGLEKSYLNDGLYTTDYKQKLIWSWAILNSKAYCFIAWGICYPKENDEWEWGHYFSNLPKKPFVFIGLFSDKNVIKENYNKFLDFRPEGWLWNNDINNEETTDLIGVATKTLDEFVSYDQDTTAKFYQFVDNKFGEIMRLADKIILK